MCLFVCLFACARLFDMCLCVFTCMSSVVRGGCSRHLLVCGRVLCVRVMYECGRSL